VRARPAALLAAALALAVPVARAGSIPNAVVVLEAAPGTPGSDAPSAPPRFVLLKDGQAFAGGTSRLETVRLEKGDLSALRKRVEAARKALGRAPAVKLGEGGPTVRLRFGDDEAVDVSLGREPSSPSPAPVSPEPEPVAALVFELLSFRHPGLVPYAPQSYAMTLREGALSGGCRRWNFTTSIVEARRATRVVPAEQARGWPTGALPGSVCGPDDRRYVLTLRPLLPGEQP
jgi:hypothetical protein